MTLRNWYAGLTERDQRMVLWGGTAAAALLLVALLWQLGASVATAQERV